MIYSIKVMYQSEREIIVMKKLRKLDYCNWIFFGVIWILYTLVMFILIYRQSVSYGGRYVSDIHPYIQHMQGIETNYEFPYPIMFLLGKLFGLFLEPNLAMTCSISLLNGLTAPVLKYYVDKYIEKIGHWNFKKAIFSTVLMFSMLFVSMLFTDFSFNSVGTRYIGVFSPNPFHNATYLATRPFTIICFFMFTELLETYESECNIKQYIVFSVAMLLTTMTKPSFIYGFLIVVAIILLVNMFKKKMSNYRQTLRFAICVIPTAIALLYQFKGLFTGTNSQGEQAGMGVEFLKAWNLLDRPIGEALLLGLAFPIIVLIFNIINLKKEKEYQLSLYVLLINLIMLMFLYEKGFRINHLNFSWGYMHAMFFSYVMSVLLLLKNTLKKTQPIFLLIIQWVVYLMHLVCGLLYFKEVLLGWSYL